jgi:MinD-like ATPase involved in chromosome partitioning or flagellar assembly
MVTINFYSYKGGVGRTMLTAQIARILAALGKNVVVADFDFDAPGIPAAFGMKLGKVQRGIFELLEQFSDAIIDGTEGLFRESLAKQIAEEYLLEISDVLKGESEHGKTGNIRILPSGCINDGYWNKLSTRDWMDFFITPPEGTKSFARFFDEFLRSTLEEMGVNYLLIDSRAGITHYSRVARHLADRQVALFCPNLETEEAVASFLLKQMGAAQKKNPLDKLVFVVSRIPPELEESDKVFQTAKAQIKHNLPNELKNKTNRTGQNLVEVLKLHSDIETHLNPQKRIMDGKYSKEGKHQPVTLNEDILTIFAALCPGVPKVFGGSLQEQAYAIWRKIYDTDFLNNLDHRLFRFSFREGEMRNLSDGERNVAFKAVTFTGFLKEFRKAFFREAEGDWKECSRKMNPPLYASGLKCGEDFGRAFAKLPVYLNTENGLAENIRQWCKFDTEAGFGRMSYEDEGGKKFLRIENLFLFHKGVRVDYSAFFTGYVVGVLREILDPYVLKTLHMIMIGGDDSLNEEYPVYRDGEDSTYPVLSLSNSYTGVLYRIEEGLS